MRISVRSFASRFESGSSKRKSADLLDQGAADGDALALAAGKLRRLAVEEMVDLQKLRRPVDALRDLFAGQLPRRQAEAQIAAHGLGRIERVGLKDHGEAAVLRVEKSDVAVADQHLALADLEEAGEDVEKRGLAAAGRAEQDDELALLDLEVEVGDDGERAVLLDDVPEFDGRHLGRAIP